jgi:hypothetical protein
MALSNLDAPFISFTAVSFPVCSYDSEHTHGTGCTLSSAIASALALGHQRRQLVESTGEHMEGATSAIYPVDACCLAKAYVTAGIVHGQAVSSSILVIRYICPLCESFSSDTVLILDSLEKVRGPLPIQSFQLLLVTIPPLL